MQYSTWSKVASENHEAAKRAAAGKSDAPVGSTGTGAERGAAIGEALLRGNTRFLGTPLARLSSDADGSHTHYRLSEPAATVLALTPLPAAAHTLLGCDEVNLFVVPCTPAGMEDLVVGNAEFGVIAQKTKAILLVAASMMQEQGVRECSDELLRQSAVMAELNGRGDIHIMRAVRADGAIVLTPTQAPNIRVRMSCTSRLHGVCTDAPMQRGARTSLIDEKEIVIFFDVSPVATRGSSSARPGGWTNYATSPSFTCGQRVLPAGQCAG